MKSSKKNMAKNLGVKILKATYPDSVFEPNHKMIYEDSTKRRIELKDGEIVKDSGSKSTSCASRSCRVRSHWHWPLRAMTW